MTTETVTRTATLTQRKIAAMLLENTGTHFMDSGGAGGRAWQAERRRFGLDDGAPYNTFMGGPGHKVDDVRDPDKLDEIALEMADAPYATLDRWGSVSVDTFQYLVERLDYDERLDSRFQRYLSMKGDSSWTAETWVEAAKHGHGQVLRGLYGDNSGVILENTYNSENDLDRTLLFTYFEVEHQPDDDERFGDRVPRLDEGGYVILSIHGGADVRGGYTDPVLFRGADADTWFSYSHNTSIHCEGVDPNPLAVPGQLTLDGEPVDHTPVPHYWQDAGGEYWEDGASNTTVLLFDTDQGAQAPLSGRHVYATIDDNDQWHCPMHPEQILSAS